MHSLGVRSPWYAPNMPKKCYIETPNFLNGTLSYKGTFTNYVYKMRHVVGTGNVNGMQIFPYINKGISSHMSTRGR